METLNDYKNGGKPLYFCKINTNGELIDGIEPLYYYDSKYDVWCIYENKDYKESQNYNCYYMKSDGRIFARHADPRRFISGLAKLYLTGEENQEKVGSRTYFKRYIFNNEGKKMLGCGFAGVKRLDSKFIHGKENEVVFEVAMFPSEYEKKRIEFGFSPMCKHYRLEIRLEDWGYKLWGLPDIKFEEAIRLGI